MWVDLTQPFDADAVHGSGPPPELDRLSTVPDDGVGLSWLGCSTHTGTHVDAPRHFLADGPTIDDLPLDRFTGEGIVLDVACGEPRELTPATLEAASGTVEDRDILLLRTGWGDRYGTASYHEYP
ncbi:cyclase family protein [Natronomonas sp. EA1]|uniref:cyclase family protein n=1 Tax=Natronomonas sp. EA1 TaxID=3421655 RepID=UPI003EB7DF05